MTQDASRSEGVPGGCPVGQWSQRTLATTASWALVRFRERLMSEDASFAPYIDHVSECGRPSWLGAFRLGHLPPVSSCSADDSRMLRRKGVDMADKSPRKVASKKSGKTLKEKRKEKKDKQEVRKGLGI